MSERDLSPQDPSRIVADLERKRALLHTINEFALNLLAIPSESELVWYVAREVVGRLGFVDCVIYRVEPERSLLRQVAAIGVKNPQDHEILNVLEIPVGHSGSPGKRRVNSLNVRPGRFPSHPTNCGGSPRRSRSCRTPTTAI